MKKIWLELDVAGTCGDEAWTAIEQPKGFFEAAVISPKKADCKHTKKQAHSEGEWREIWVQVEDKLASKAITFYKKQERVLAVETED